MDEHSVMAENSPESAPGKGQVLLVVLVALTVLVLPGWVVGLCLHELHRFQVAPSWPSSPGIVEGVTVDHESWGSKEYWYPQLSFVYEVEGEGYRGYCVDLTGQNETLNNWKSFASLDEARAHLRSYKRGDQVKVFYSPDDPTYAVLRTDRPPSSDLWTMLGCGLILLLVGLFIFGKDQSWRTRVGSAAIMVVAIVCGYLIPYGGDAEYVENFAKIKQGLVRHSTTP